MPDDPKPSQRRRSKWPRRLAYITGWFVLMALCLTALFAALAWVGYKNITPIANLARDKFAHDYPIEIGSITFPEKGLIELRDLTLDLPDDAGQAGKIDRVQLRYDPSDLFKPRARSLTIENPNFTLDDRLLGMFAPKEDTSTKSKPETKNKANTPAKPSTPNWAKLDQLKIINGTIDLNLKGIPRSTWHVDLEAEDIDLSSEGNLLSAKPQRVTLRDIQVEDPTDSQLPKLIDIEELTADLSLHKDFTSGAVADLHLKNPIVRFTPKLIAALEEEQQPTPQKETTAPGTDKTTPAPQPPPTPMRWSIKEITLENGFFAMTDFHDTPDFSFHHTGTFTDLSWSSNTGLEWPTHQAATITDIRFDARALPSKEFENPDTQLLATADQIHIAGRPDEFFEHGWIDKIATRNPQIHVTEENIRRFLTPAPQDPSKLIMTPSEKAPPTEPATTTSAATSLIEPEPYIIRVRDLEIADAAVTIESDGFMPGLPDTKLNLNIRSSENQPDPTEDIHYQISATALDVHARGSNQPIVAGKEILTELTANGIQRDQRIESITLSGIQIRVGTEVEDIIAALDTSDPTQPSTPLAPTDPEEPSLDLNPDPLDLSSSLEELAPEWKIGTLTLQETRFALENFIPGLPYVPLVIETTLTEVPLSGRKRGEERLQRIELRNLEIASTANSLIPVAKLNSIWINFTIPGLIRNEIEAIEIVGPEIYLGEHLFWYVNYYRKLAESDDTETTEPKPEPEPVVITEKKDDTPLEKGKISVVEDALRNTEISGWKIKYVEASTGKLIVAPKGYPIGILPFPFTAKTNLAEGKIELDLKVPPGDYVFEQLELEMRGLNGEAFFNYPIRAKNNNFVQTFKVPEFRFQKYEADEVYLSVTYDENGIYGQLGGKAYSGYAEGAFNIYIGETYKWDAWVAGTKLNLEPITALLSPENVTVTGILDAKIIANGEGFVPEKITGDMTTSGKCHMHVTKLDEVLESLPEVQLSEQKGRVDILEAFIDPITTGVQNAISKAGIEAFRHYDFTTGTAKIELDGRDGTASMLLDGPDGKRDITFRFFDKRELAATAKKPQ